MSSKKYVVRAGSKITHRGKAVEGPATITVDLDDPDEVAHVRTLWRSRVVSPKAPAPKKTPKAAKTDTAEE